MGIPCARLWILRRLFPYPRGYGNDLACSFVRLTDLRLLQLRYPGLRRRAGRPSQGRLVPENRWSRTTANPLRPREKVRGSEVRQQQDKAAIGKHPRRRGARAVIPPPADRVANRERRGHAAAGHPPSAATSTSTATPSTSPLPASQGLSRDCATALPGFTLPRMGLLCSGGQSP
jgi:hypothetical protein